MTYTFGIRILITPLVSDIAIFVLKGDVKLQLTHNAPVNF